MGYLYKTNHDYFKNIDSELKAYLLGLIYADGCIKSPKGNRQGGFAISLQEQDGYILNNFSELTSSPAKFYHSPSVIKKGWGACYILRVASNEIYNDLVKIGCGPNKSKVGMKFPELIPELIPHFIRGFLDGDGSIIFKKPLYKYKRITTIKRNKIPKKYMYKLKIAFCNTDKQFLEDIINFLQVKPYIRQKLKTSICYTYWIEGLSDVIKTIDILYKDATIFLKRKRDKVEEYNMSIKSQAEGTLSEGLETT